MSSLGDFLDNEQDEKQKNAKALQILKDQFDTALNTLYNSIREWLSAEITKGQVQVSTLHPNRVDDQLVLTIKASTGTIEFRTSAGFILGTAGHLNVTNSSKQVSRVMVFSKDGRWLLKDDVRKQADGRAAYDALDENSFPEMIIELLKGKKP